MWRTQAYTGNAFTGLHACNVASGIDCRRTKIDAHVGPARRTLFRLSEFAHKRDNAYPLCPHTFWIPSNLARGPSGRSLQSPTQSCRRSATWLRAWRGVRRSFPARGVVGRCGAPYLRRAMDTTVITYATQFNRVEGEGLVSTQLKHIQLAHMCIA